MKNQMKQVFVIKVKGHRVRNRDKWEYFTGSGSVFCSPEINDSFFYTSAFACVNASQDIRILKASHPDYDFKVVEVEQIAIIREKP